MRPLPRMRMPAAPAWRCRRGMKELDVLLERYAALGAAAGARRPSARASRELLALPDPVLAAYLLGGAMPRRSRPWRTLVGRIRALCRSAA